MSDALALFDAPIVRTISKVRVAEFRVSHNALSASVLLERLYDDDTGADHIEVFVQSSTDGVATPTALVAFLAALGTAAPGETGSAARRTNYRILRFLKEGGYLNGVSVVA